MPRVLFFWPLTPGAALFARARTGKGQHVDVSYLDTSVALLAAMPNMRLFFSDGLAPKHEHPTPGTIEGAAGEEDRLLISASAGTARPQQQCSCETGARP